MLACPGHRKAVPYLTSSQALTVERFVVNSVGISKRGSGIFLGESPGFLLETVTLEMINWVKNSYNFED